MSYGHSETSRLKYFKRLKVYKNSTGTCVLHAENKKELEARSYSHWLFLTNIKGVIVFNDYSYSVSTSAHQSCVRSILEELKIKIGLVVYQRESLDRGVQIDEIVKDRELAIYKLKRKGLSQKTRKNLEFQRDHADKKLKVLRTKLKISVPRKLLEETRIEVAKEETERLERNRAERALIKKRTVDPKIKKELNSLGEVDLLNTMNSTDDLGKINF